MKTQKSVYVEPQLWNRAKNKVNISQILTQTLELITGSNNNRAEIVKEIKQKETELLALKTQLKNLEIKDGITFTSYIEHINSNELYTEETKAIIRDDLARSVEILNNGVPAQATARAIALRNKYGIDVTAKMLLNFSHESGVKPCVCDYTGYNRAELLGQRCGKCFGIIRQEKGKTEKREDVLTELRTAMAVEVSE